MATIHTVVWGDTLSELAVKYNTTVANLVKLNNITDPNFIVVGQKLVVSGTSTTTQTTVNTTSRPVIKAFGLQTNTDRTMYATWTWSKSNTDSYQVMWYYDTGNGVWFVGNDSTVRYNQSTYSAPENAKQVRFKVKPISKTHKVNNKETAYWTASWSTESIYSFANNPPSKPGVPEVTIKDYTLTATLRNLVVNADQIQFQIVKNDTSIYKNGTATIKTNSASYACSVAAGSTYKVRARSVRGKLYSDWSEYSNNVETSPATPNGTLTCRATSETSVYLEWKSIVNAESYEIEYTTEKKYFDGSDQTTTVSSIKTNHYEKTGLTSGEEYFFRVRAVNNGGTSSWSSIASVIIGKAPAAPTTWSSTTTATVGKDVILYWVHNTEDGSSQTYADLELYIDGVRHNYTIKNSTEEDEKDKTSSYVFSTSGYREGTKVQWRVRTAGIMNKYGEWSIQRTIDVYAPPALELSVTDSSGNYAEILTSFPIHISAIASPNTQTPMGYHVTIVSGDSYETVDHTGSTKFVSAGETVFSRHFDISDSLSTDISAGDVDLENNVRYTITCTVSMNSGLTAESEHQFTVSWTDIEYEPNAEISLDEETYSISIRPYCEDEKAILLNDVLMSVYRREFDGSFVELAKDIDNGSNTFVTDPHPALDYARYRVVARSKTTGAVSYYDVPGYPVNGIAVIIQWDEDWTNFNAWTENELDRPTWAGSMLKLPYNVDISDNVKPDVELIEYIGRSHPVSYYGTQLGQSATWNTVIPADDKETLYGLRRLAKWTGDVYVREPSGSGYWANIQVSFSQKHNDVIIPVTLSVTRVEGGV